MSKRNSYKHYLPEFKKMIIGHMLEKKLSYCKTATRFEGSCDT